MDTNLVMLFDEEKKLIYDSNTVIKTCLYSHWARGKSRYYVDVVGCKNMVRGKDCFDYKCTDIILDSLKDIWSHPHYNLLYYYREYPQILKLVPQSMLTYDICKKLALAKPHI